VAFKAVAAVTGNDGNPLVDVDGVDAQFCANRRQLLGRIGDELNFWGRTWRMRHGTPPVPITSSEDGEEEDADDYDDDDDYESSEEVEDEVF
jgi:hypothetical protein